MTYKRMSLTAINANGYQKSNIAATISVGLGLILVILAFYLFVQLYERKKLKYVRLELRVAPRRRLIATMIITSITFILFGSALGYATKTNIQIKFLDSIDFATHDIAFDKVGEEYTIYSEPLKVRMSRYEITTGNYEVILNEATPKLMKGQVIKLPIIEFNNTPMEISEIKVESKVNRNQMLIAENFGYRAM